MAINIIKRDGRKEKYDSSKVKRAIAWASDGLQVNPLELESAFSSSIKEGLTTKSVQENLIYSARMLCTAKATDWSFVAGRLETMNTWKETQIFEKTFYYYIREQVKLGNYCHPALKQYTKNDIMELGKHINQMLDLTHSYSSVLTARQKYLTQGECIQQMHMVNAMIICSVETGNRIPRVVEVYKALSERKISLATPWLSNLRSNKNISSCFIIQVDDHLVSIFDNVKNAALISRSGGGVGIDLSLIRANGSAVNGRAKSSKGVISWTKIFNDTSVSVDQGGRRKGAFTVHVPIWHRDIEDFLEIQTENGDLRRKCFDIKPQIGVYDAFFKEVTKDNGGSWYTFCPYEVETVLGLKLQGSFGRDFITIYKKCILAFKNKQLNNVGVYNAKTLLKSIMRVQFETGLPYLVFLDRINEANPNNHEGYIPCTNLCTESYSVVAADTYAHTCNLASVVVGRMESDEEIIKTAALCTRILDNGLALTKSPISISDKHNERYRTIGIGIQGLHDFVAKRNLTWDNYKEFTKLAELIEYGAVKESILLAKERGKYPAFVGSKWDTGEMLERFTANSVSRLCKWETINNALKKYGIRNSQLTSPAPNTSTSLFMDATAGVMPVFSAFYNENNSNGKVSVFGMYIKENPLCYENTAPRHSQEKLVKVVAALQTFVDTGISAEYIFDLNNPEIDAKSLYDTILTAWRLKTKAIYYIRTIKKGETIDKVIGGESECVGCSG